MVLDKVNYPEDVKKLSLSEKNELACEIREKILDIVSKNGGHLASNLGVVELTIALHSCFSMPDDKIVWDVGHQSYVHKILTGRKDKIESLRQLNGIAGFPRTGESEYDSFDTGHSSTSISVALGMARARDIEKKNNKVIAVIGDGALTGGMAMEALNDAGYSKTDLIVILNDNEMSISRNTGGLSLFLTKLRTRKFYTKSNVSGKNFIKKIPLIGDKFVSFIVNLKKGIKQLIIPKMYFEDIGFRYLGPIDGHNIEEMEAIFKSANELSGPVLIHVITKKGKGYKPAEENPDKFHSTSSFDIKTGIKNKSQVIDYSKFFGEKIVEIGEKNDKIVAITAAMKDGTGLGAFAEKFPNRFFDVGIAEQHAISMAAGMARNGLKPFFAVYSSFLQRGYDQLVHDVCLQNLPVTFCIDRAGVVGNDGETHQGLLDFSFLNTIPNMNIMAPKNFEELKMMLEFASCFDKPLAIRYPRGTESLTKFDKSSSIKFGKAEVICDGDDVYIFSIGKMVAYSKEVSNNLNSLGISCGVVNMRFLKPVDENLIKEKALRCKLVVTIEDNSIIGGLSLSVNSVLKNSNCKILNLAYPDCFVKHGSVYEIEKKYGMDIDGLTKKIKEKWDDDAKGK